MKFGVAGLRIVATVADRTDGKGNKNTVRERQFGCVGKGVAHREGQ